MNILLVGVNPNSSFPPKVFDVTGVEASIFTRFGLK